MKKILTVIGTRPEAIKMAPVIAALQQVDRCRTVVVASAQHRHLLDQVLDLFSIRADDDLNVMRDGQSLAQLTSALFTGLDAMLEKHRPDLVLAQGDTTTAMVAAVTAFYRRIPFGHIEAGLRTGDLENPFPEEFNRIVAGRVASFHFAPTQGASEALKAEGVPASRILVTGNTVIDALLLVARSNPPMPIEIPKGRRLVLMTAHRRESFGAPLASVFMAVRRLTAEFQDLHVVYPVHPNPNVRTMARDMLVGLERVHLVEPLDYGSLVACLKHCHFVMTDSGGLQEEAPALGKPVLVLRTETERPEGVTAGVARLVGTDEDTLLSEARKLLNDAGEFRKMARSVSPYGDGRAAARIVTAIAGSLQAPREHEIVA